MNPAHDHPWPPTRELLAAFADGELADQPELRRRIEGWLADHPESRAEVTAQANLSRLLAATTPCAPEPVAWAKVWQRIENGLQARRQRRPAARWLTGLAAAGAAAAVLLYIFRQPLETPAPQPPSWTVARVDRGMPAAPRNIVPQRPTLVQQVEDADAMEVLPVAAADEVEILQFAGADPRTPVVGRLPWSGPMILLKAHEVEVKPPFQDMTRMGGGSTPILMMPLDPDDHQ